MSKKILSVKLIKKGEGLFVHSVKSGTLTVDEPLTYKNQVHPDLEQSIQKLAPHLAVLTDCIKEKQISDADLVKQFYVTGYSIGGKDEQEGIVITGYRSIPRGTVTLNSPFIRMEQTETNPYLLLKAMLSCIDEIETEVIEYTENGKQAQGDMFQGQGGKKEKSTTVKVLPPASQDNVTLADIKAMKGKNDDLPEDYDPLGLDEELVYELDGIKYGDKDEYERAKVKADRKAEKKAGQKKRVPQTAKNRSGITEE